MAIKYFLYSEEQLNFRKTVEAKSGKKFKPGTVVVNGTRKPFTELSSSQTSKFRDVKIVTSGDPDAMTYTLPKSV